MKKIIFILLLAFPFISKGQPCSGISVIGTQVSGEYKACKLIAVDSAVLNHVKAQSLTVNGNTVDGINVSGNAGTATKLQTARTINGTSFDGSANITVPSQLIATSVKTSNYTAAANDFIPCNTTSGSFTVTLPTAPIDRTQVGVKMVIQGSTNTVSIVTGGSDVFNKTGGGTTLTLSLLNQAVTLMYSSSGAIWYVLADDLTLSSLDSRYQASLTNPVTGTGISSQVPYFNGTSTLAGDTNLVFDATNKRLGIGTSSPAALLHLQSNSTTPFNSSVLLDGYTTNGAGAIFVGRKARGSFSSPSAINAFDNISAITAFGHNGTSFPASSNAFMVFYASENFTPTSTGTSVQFGLTAKQSTVNNVTVKFTGDQVNGFGTTATAGPAALIDGRPNNLTSSFWSTNGIGLRISGTYTDNTSSGTVASGYHSSFGGATLNSTNATVYTNYFNLNIDPISLTGNASATNNYALRLGGNSLIAGGGNINFSGVAPSIGSLDAQAVALKTNGSTRISIGGANGNIVYTNGSPSTNSQMATWTQSAATGGTNNLFIVTGGAHTGQSTAELTDVLFNLSNAVTITDGSIATQRAFRIQPRTYTPVTSSLSITDAATFEVGTPVAGTGTTFTRKWNTRFVGNGMIGIGGSLYIGDNNVQTAATAKLHLAAGTASANTAPLKFTTGTSLTSAEAGAVEYTTDDLFFTISTGTARKRFLFADPSGGLTSGRMPFATTNGRLTDDASLTYSTSTGLTTTKNITAPHLIGQTSAPTIAAGTGAGTSPTVSVSKATDLSGIITVTTGTLPTLSATVVTVTFNVTYGSAPTVTIDPANNNAAFLSGVNNVFVDDANTTTSQFVLTAGTTALAAATTYKWTYRIIQ